MNRKDSTIVNTQLIYLLFLLFLGCKENEISAPPQYKIEIVSNLSAGLEDPFFKDSTLKIQYSLLSNIGGVPEIKVLKKKITNNKAHWVFYSAEDILLFHPFGRTILVHPGDNFSIYVNNGNTTYIGKGKDTARFNFLNKLTELEKGLIRPGKNSLTLNSPQDFWLWNQYADNAVVQKMALLESYKSRLPEIEYTFYKQRVIGNAESDRVSAFGALLNYKRTDSGSKYTDSDLIRIWDSTQYKPWAVWLRTLPDYNASVQEIYAFMRLETQRNFDFNPQKDSLKSKEMRTYLYYKNARDNFKGVLRENLMVFILNEQTIIEMGPNNIMAQKILKDYYSQPGYPEFKKWVKNLEETEKAKELEYEKKKTSLSANNITPKI